MHPEKIKSKFRAMSVISHSFLKFYIIFVFISLTITFLVIFRNELLIFHTIYNQLNSTNNNLKK